MKIRRVGAKLFQADERTDRETDMTKLIVAFLNFANAPKNIRSPEMWLKILHALVCRNFLLCIQTNKQTCQSLVLSDYCTQLYKT